MTSDPSDLLPFFEGYARASLHGEPSELAAVYAPTFLAAGPKGSAAFANDAKLLEWLGQVRDFNRASGMRSMRPTRVEAQPLSAAHALATVQWSARFDKTGDREIAFQIAYLVERSADTWKILAYVSQEDQEDEMKRLGLL